MATKSKAKVVVATDKNLLSLQSLPKNTIIRAYKVIGRDGSAPVQKKPMGYEVGGTYKQKRCNRNPREDCGIGLHVATRDWVIDYVNCLYETCNTVMTLVEFRVRDIGCVPHHRDWDEQRPCGKFRVTKFTIVKKLRWPKSY